MDRLIADLDREFPGFATTVVHREMATAETMQHYLNTPHGAVYGFAPETLGFAPRTTISVTLGSPQPSPVRVDTRAPCLAAQRRRARYCASARSCHCRGVT